MTNRKILFFMSSGSAVGGVETWLSNIVESLSSSGYEPIVALSRGLKSNNPKRFQRIHPNLPSVEVDGAGLPRASRVLACLRVIKRIRPATVLPLGMIDAVPACGLAKSGNRDIRIIARTQGLLAPMLADLEDFESIFDFAVCDGLLNARYLREAIGFPKELIRHVPNGARIPVRPRKLRRSEDPIRLVYVGRLTSGDKRADDLIELVTELEKLNLLFTLTIVGDGPLMKPLEAALGVKKNIHITGSLSHDDVYQNIYPNADCLISLSSSESFGISIVEAMMNGVVPVSSQFLGWRTVGTIDDGETALTFKIGDMKVAAELIFELSKSPGLLEKFSNRAAKRAQSKFSWERCCSEWIEILNEVGGVPQRKAVIDCKSYLASKAGKLDLLQLPPSLIDLFRRSRVRIAPIVRPGGEEWPLFFNHHSRRRLNEISEFCENIDQ